MRPLFSWPGRVGAATITYNPVLQRYLFVATDGRSGTGVRFGAC